MSKKNVIALVSLIVLLVGGLVAVVYAYNDGMLTYDGSKKAAIDRVISMGDEDVTITEPDGIASVIVDENLSKTKAANNVAAVVFDFRGFDTIGESFILFTAISGSFVILTVHKRKKKEEDEA